MNADIHRGDDLAQFIAHLSTAYSALIHASNVANNGNGGAGEWWHEAYPFGVDLDEFICSFGNYILQLKGTNQ